MQMQRRQALLACAATALAGCAATSPQTAATAQPDSDAPETPATPATGFEAPPSYAEALQRWRSVDEVNAWIGARFEYDMARALRLSETQRQQNGRLPIIAPAAFFETPRGVCVDLARFGVETLRSIDPAAKPLYLMIEFDPLQINGNTLRRHWVVAFQREGRTWVFGDSKRPGHIAGPYNDLQTYIADYARYRGRSIAAHRELPSYERQMRRQAVKETRQQADS
ncbi:MAG: transglutaminase-like domain-containing protein [Rubrivivax sp.]